MPSFFDKLKEKAAFLYDETGAVVSIKTDITPEIKLFDSGEKTDNRKLPRKKLINYALIVRNKNGKIIYQQGKYPETNHVKSLVIYSGLGIIGFTFLLGLISIYKRQL